MKPFARISLSSAALRRGILVSSLAFAAMAEAEPLPPKLEDKLIRTKGFMACSFRLEFIRQVGLVLRHACTPFAESRQHT